MVITIGILALQGDFQKHQAIFQRLQFETKLVRYVEDLADISALVIPGGESTVLSKHLDSTGLRGAIEEFGRLKPVMGTCAGLIMMSHDVGETDVEPLNFIDLTVNRNGWGRQVHSFATEIDANLDHGGAAIPAVFIRAPRITDVGPDVEVLAKFEGEPVWVRQGLHTAMTFHPELTDDTRIHAHFLEQVTA